ncbi:PEP-CTERM sorting domain-containing protein [Cellvibrio sp. NN19]|uniref:PEP-CTERM sorting domain-containing protein n=1 Tax=Cellvibrio chitinivorans TaxID=3102792 RepID=UPI002B4075D8|nr:PEP-CTERM sorting domain-containing protein [Cellvibrio sp. NN19]
MKKAHSLLLSLFLSLGLITAANTQAAVITFDDLPATDVDAIPENYNGFIWGDSFFTNVSYINKNTIPDSGYANGVVSGDYAAFNIFSTTSMINTSDGEQFDFNGAYLTAGLYDGLNIEVTGLLNSLVLFTQTITVNTQQAQWFDFNFLGINSLSLRAWGSPSGNDFFVLDNFTYNETSVPESSSLALLLLGMTGLLLSRKTQKA